MDSWYYFNGRPVSCSLCTVVSCDSCGFAYKWGDQFRLDVCDFCYDGNVITTRRSQSRRRLRAKRPIVYERMFERRCHCCDDLEILPGLKYLSYDDPGICEACCSHLLLMGLPALIWRLWIFEMSSFTLMSRHF